MTSIGIGLVGCGTVGGGVWKNLERNRDLIAQRTGIDFHICKVAVRDTSKDRGIPANLITKNWREVIEHPDVKIVVELMGGTETALEVVLAAIRAGKPVVTANKALLAECGEQVCNEIEKRKVPIYFEASVAGGIPIIKALREGLRANKIRSIHGIINGTCNYILTRMTAERESFEKILAEAKALGYAEADESLDVDGIDAAHKAVILASIAYGFWITPAQAYIEGIRNITTLDIDLARKFDYGLKLLAIIRENENGAVEVRVHPTLIPANHVLASVSGVYNAVAVEGDVVGQTLFYGRGAGADPTASAVLSDLCEAGLHLVSGHKPCSASGHNLHGKVVTIDEVSSRYYVRLTVQDTPGVLAQIAAIFGRHQIGISSVYQPEGQVSDGAVSLVLMLDRAKEALFQASVAEIEALSIVKGKAQVIRVEDFK